MKHIVKKITPLFLASSLFACHASNPVVEQVVPGSITEKIPGTETTANLVSFLDKKPGLKFETMVNHTGGTFVWVGPKEFMIEFKDVSPFKNKKGGRVSEFKAENHTVVIDIPQNALEGFKLTCEKSEYGKEICFKDFKYNVVIDGVVLDPFARIIEQ